MSTVTMSKDTGGYPAEDKPLITGPMWVQIGVLSAIFIYLFSDIFYRAFGVDFGAGGVVTRGYAWTDGNWSHALVVPLIALYFVAQHREEIKRTPVKPSYLFGVPLMVFGIAFYAMSVARTVFGSMEGEEAQQIAKAFQWISNDMFKGYAMVMTLGGMVWLLAGTRMIRWLWFPIFYLVFAIKISDRVWEMIAFKLQGVASEGAGIMINLLGFPLGIEADIAGNQISIWHHGMPEGALNVVEQCSGLRMLMTFIALGFAVAYLANRPWWARLVMVGLTVPVAIVVNMGRVTAMGLIYPYNKELTQGDFHVFIGMLMLIPALGLFMLIGWVMNQLVVEAPATEVAEGES